MNNNLKVPLCALLFNLLSSCSSDAPPPSTAALESVMNHKVVNVEPQALKAFPEIVKKVKFSSVFLVGDFHLSGKGREILVELIKKIKPRAFIIEGYGPEAEESLNDEQKIIDSISFSYDIDGIFSGKDMILSIHKAAVPIYGAEDTSLLKRSTAYLSLMDTDYHSTTQHMNKRLSAIENDKFKNDLVSYLTVKGTIEDRMKKWDGLYKEFKDEVKDTDISKHDVDLFFQILKLSRAIIFRTEEANSFYKKNMLDKRSEAMAEILNLTNKRYENEDGPIILFAGSQHLNKIKENLEKIYGINSIYSLSFAPVNTTPPYELATLNGHNILLYEDRTEFPTHDMYKDNEGDGMVGLEAKYFNFKPI